MTKFISIVMVALMTLSASAAGAIPVKKLPLAKVETFKTARTAEIDDEICYDEPEGEFAVMCKDADAFKLDFSSAVHSKVYGSALSTVTDGETLYFSNPIAEYPVFNWAKATIEGDKLVYRGAQAITVTWDDNDDEVTLYLIPLLLQIDDATQQGTYIADPDMTYELVKGEDGAYHCTDATKMLGVCYMLGESDNIEWAWTGYGDRDITISEITSKPVEVPETAEKSLWVWNSNYTSRAVAVALDGNDIYVAGLDPAIKDAWVKGSIADGKAVFPSGQYLGVNEELCNLSYFFGATVKEETHEYGDAYFTGELTDQLVFNYDAENGQLLTEGENGYAINGSPTHTYILKAFADVLITDQHRNPETIPAAPYDLVWQSSELGNSLWFQLPNTDIDGNLLNEANLYYEFLLNGELYTFSPDDYYDLTEATTRIPYNLDGYDFYVYEEDHTVYFYFDDFETLGVRSAYLNENNNWIYSETVYITNAGVNDIVSSSDIVSEECFDTTGTRIHGETKGIQIVKTTYSDGTVRVSKRIVR